MRKIFLAVVLISAVAVQALERQPNQAYRARRVALSKLTDGGIVVLFAPMADAGERHRLGFGFRQNSNFYYLTGWAEPDAAVVIAPAVPAKDGQPAREYTEILFLADHNVTVERWTGPKLGGDDAEAAQVTGFDRVQPLDRLRDELVKLAPPTRVTIYSDLAEFGDESESEEPLRWLRRSNAFPNYVSFEDVKKLIASLRMVKDAGEMALIRKATEASMEAHRAAMRLTKPGIAEREISAAMVGEFMKRGCERPSYPPIVGSGVHGTVLHYNENSDTVPADTTIVMDVGCEYSMYATDITRTLPSSGKFTARQREIYEIVLGAAQAARAAFKAGVSTLGRTTPNSLHQVAADYINRHGKDLKGGPLGKYFIHGLGHHVGLDVHDPNDPKRPLDKGMVFTFEPGIYIPEEKFGVRIEDMMWVDENGKLVSLSDALPRTPDDVERAMAGR